jgi:hypothetical protein
MKPDQAITAMRQHATNIAIERARLAGAMRAIRDMGGIDAVRTITASEIEKLTASANDNGAWIG